MYHSISNHSINKLHPYYSTVTSPERFEKHMKFLKKNKYNVITLDTLQFLLTRSDPYLQNSVVITFDDGLEDFYQNAWPVLREYNFPATVFLTVNWVGNNIDNKYLDWHQIHELSKNGISFGSHSLSHGMLHLMPQEAWKREVAVSKEIIESKTGKVVHYFSYPYAFPEHDTKFIHKLKEILRASGYERCLTTIIGRVSLGDNGFFFKRIPINSEDDMSLLMVKLQGGYDWLRFPQWIVKKLQNRKPKVLYYEDSNNNAR